jgi:hypothetical protein
LRDRVSPHSWVFTHRYGVPNLRMGGFRRLGMNLTQDWIKPQFRRRGYLAPGGTPTAAQLALMSEIIEYLMDRFGDMLMDLQMQPATRRFHVASTPGVLNESHWRDEMHLTDAGFRIAARTMQPKLRELFPIWTAA